MTEQLNNKNNQYIYIYISSTHLIVQMLLLYCDFFLLGQILLSLIELNTPLSMYTFYEVKPLVNYLGLSGFCNNIKVVIISPF